MVATSCIDIQFMSEKFGEAEKRKTTALIAEI
jgi:hypothetical protein